MYIVNALVRSVLLLNVFGKRTNHILTVTCKCYDSATIEHLWEKI